jgi:hypothetical protein
LTGIGEPALAVPAYASAPKSAAQGIHRFLAGPARPALPGPALGRHCGRGNLHWMVQLHRPPSNHMHCFDQAPSPPCIPRSGVHERARRVRPPSRAGGKPPGQRKWTTTWGWDEVVGIEAKARPRKQGPTAEGGQEASRTRLGDSLTELARSRRVNRIVLGSRLRTK